MKLPLILSALFLSTHATALPLACEPGIMTTPTYGITGGLFSICAQTIIDSPPAPIYNVLADFAKYHEWNSFVYAVDLTSQPIQVGTTMVFHTSGLVPGINTTSDELITYLEDDTEPSFVAWRFNPGALVVALMQAEHVSLLQRLENGQTNYVSWETYYGAGALAVLSLKDNLQTQFEVQGRELKARVEE